MADPNSSTIRKAVDLLFVLNQHRVPLGVTDVARELGAPKASAHRLLQSLRHRGLVEQDDHGRYRLGMGLLILAQGVAVDDPLLAAARDILRKAASDLQETFFLVVARSGGLLVADKAEGSGFLRVSPSIGSVVPVQGTAVGRVYRTFAPEQVARGNTDHDEAQVIAQCRRERVARSYEEWQAGLSAIAAPVFDGPRLVGAVVAALLGPRLQQVGEERVLQAVKAAGRDIETRLATSRLHPPR